MARNNICGYPSMAIESIWETIQLGRERSKVFHRLLHCFTIFSLKFNLAVTLRPSMNQIKLKINQNLIELHLLVAHIYVMADVRIVFQN